MPKLFIEHPWVRHELRPYVLQMLDCLRDMDAAIRRDPAEPTPNSVPSTASKLKRIIYTLHKSMEEVAHREPGYMRRLQHEYDQEMSFLVFSILPKAQVWAEMWEALGDKEVVLRERLLGELTTFALLVRA